MTAEEWTALRLSFQVAMCAAVARTSAGRRRGVLAGPRTIRGQVADRGRRQPSPGAAAGGNRISVADPSCAARADRRGPARLVRRQDRIHLVGRGVGFAGHGFSADGPRHPTWRSRRSIRVWKWPPERSGQAAPQPSSRSACRWPGGASWPAGCSPLPAASVNSAPRSWSPATSKDKPARSRWRSTRFPISRTEWARHGGSWHSRCCSPAAHWQSANCWNGGNLEHVRA